VLEFTRSGLSGGSYSLPGGFRLTREFEVFRFHKPAEMNTAESRSLLVPDSKEGSGLLLLDGEGFKVSWGPAWQAGSTEGLEIPLLVLEFPLRLRGWEPGDRIQLPFGTKKLKKLFGESKIPVERRQRIPILLDSQDRILWVAGLASSVLIAASVGTEAFFLGIRNVDQD